MGGVLGSKRGPYKVRDRSAERPPRFWAKVDRGEPAACWPWTGHRDPLGYGRFQWASYESRMAHRAAWELANGQISEGQLVCHRCDNPPCCNPAHLFLGTDADNARDRDRKGRLGNRKGSANGRAKLTEADVAIIRSLFGHVSHAKLAVRFGVASPTISAISRGQNWH